MSQIGGYREPKVAQPCLECERLSDEVEALRSERKGLKEKLAAANVLTTMQVHEEVVKPCVECIRLRNDVDRLRNKVGNLSMQVASTKRKTDAEKFPYLNQRQAQKFSEAIDHGPSA